jgi:hypothetical protein
LNGKCPGTLKRTKEIILTLIIQTAMCGIRLNLHLTNRISEIGRLGRWAGCNLEKENGLDNIFEMDLTQWLVTNRFCIID